MEVVQVDSDDVKENVHTNDSGVKIGRTKRFFSEKKRYVEPTSEETSFNDFSGL